MLTTIPLWLLVATRALARRTRPAAAAAAALAAAAAPGAGEPDARRAVRAVDRARASGWLIRRPYFERIHYDLVQTYLRGLLPGGPAGARGSRSSPRARRRTPTPASRCWCAAGTPGPADSFTLMYALMHWYGREPRVVLKDTLAVGPGHRRAPQPAAEPVHLGRSRGAATDARAQVGDLARNLDENDAFVIFPEGGNFTPERRQRAIDRLRRLGLEAMARRAERMQQRARAPARAGCSPRSTRRPEADVVLVAHTGLDHLVTRARRLARAADGQADHHALVAGAARGDPAGPGGAHRLAVRLVGADRRLGRRSTAPSTCRPGLAAPAGLGRSGGRRAEWPAMPGSTACSTSISVDRVVRRGGVVRHVGGVGGGLGRVGGGRVVGASARCAPAPAAPTGPAGGGRGRRRRRGVGRLPVGGRLLGCRASWRRRTRCRRGRARPAALRHAVLLLGASTSPLSAAATALPRLPVSARTSSVASSTAASAAVSAGSTSLVNRSRASETYGAALSRASLEHRGRLVAGVGE